LQLLTKATGIGASAGSPDLANREQARVAASNEALTTQSSTVRTLCASTSPHQKEHY